MKHYPSREPNSGLPDLKSDTTFTYTEQTLSVLEPEELAYSAATLYELRCSYVNK